MNTEFFTHLRKSLKSFFFIIESGKNPFKIQFKSIQGKHLKDHFLRDTKKFP